MPLFNNLGILTGSIYLYKDGEALASGSKLTISPDFTTTGKYDFIYETSGSTSVKLLTLSSSGQDPRVGIGNENPQTTLDIKEVKDDTVGAEILIRSSRTTKGGEVGDGAGKILFVIDSGSYTDVKSSGSVAIITTEVKAINSKMAGGDLIFKVSDTELSDPEPATVLRFSRDTSTAGFTQNYATMSAALYVEDNITSTKGITGDNLSSNTTITATSYIYSADSIRIGSNTAPTTKGLYVSGNITSSNDLSIRGFPSVSASLASLASGVGTLQQVTDAGNTTSNPISSSFNGVGFFGTASWAINVVNGGGGGGGGSDSAFLDQSTPAVTWSFAHNLGTQYPVITVYDTTGQVIIPQEIDGEDTNNLKIYFPTSQSGYATAVGGTSALTYYSQSLTTASVSLNTITFTKGDSSTFNITVNTGSSTITSSFALTASYINPLRQDIIITGSTYITGGFEALGSKGSKIQLGTYNVGYDLGAAPTFYITGSGLIISGNMPDQNHHNFLKIGNVELVDVNTAATSNEFLIHNVNTLRITSGTDGGDITNTNQLLKIGSGEFYVYRAGSKNSLGIIRSTGTTTTIEDTNISLEATNLSLTPTNLNISIPDTNEISTLNGTDYLVGFGTNPTPSAQLTQKIKASKFIWTTGSNQIISGGLIITGSTNSSGGFTGSLFGTASWAINVVNGGGGSTNTGSLLTTASVNLNTITFTKGDGTTFPITVNTGSGGGGGGSDFPYTGSAIISGSLIVTGSTLIAGSLIASTNITASRAFLSSSNGTANGSTLTVYGSGSSQPVFTVQGSSGELFSVTDSLTGSLFSVNDISGLPILEVFSDNSVLIGSYLDPMLISTAKVTQTNSGSFTVYNLPTASYDTAFFEYSVRSGSNARAGQIMAIQNGTNVNFTETTTTDFGSTSAISFTVIITGSNMALTGSSTTGLWTIKTIVRGI